MTDWRELTLRMCSYIDDSIVDGPGMRFALFTQGCPHGCEGCHNPETHDFSQGTTIDLGKIFDEVMENPLLEGITFSGGEPFCQPGPLAVLGAQIKSRGLDVTTFTGFTYEVLLKKAETEPDVSDLLAVTDLLVDGPFVLADKNLELLYRGSENQRLIDLAAMRKAGDMSHIIIWEGTP